MGKNKEVIVYFILFLIIVLVGLFIYLGSSHLTPTGYYSFGDYERGDPIQASYDSNSVYLWEPKEDIQIKYVGLNGHVSGKGTLKVTLFDEENSYELVNLDVNDENISFTNLGAENIHTLARDAKYILRYEVGGVSLDIESISYSSDPIRTFLSRTPFIFTKDNLKVELNKELNYEVKERDDGKFNVVINSINSEFTTQEETTTPKVILKGVNSSVNAKLSKLNNSFITTEVFAMDSIDLDSAELRLKKSSLVDTIYYCEIFDIEKFVCNDNWIPTKINFTEEGNEILLTVEHFSAYAGGFSGQWEFDNSTITFLESPFKGETWIYWNWSNPSDNEYDHTEVWFNNTFVMNTTQEFYNATGLMNNVNYTISLRAVDNVTNITSFVNSTIQTSKSNIIPNLTSIYYNPYTPNGYNDTFITLQYYDGDMDEGKVYVNWLVNDASVLVESKNASNYESITFNLSSVNYNLNDNLKIKVQEKKGE